MIKRSLANNIITTKSTLAARKYGAHQLHKESYRLNSHRILEGRFAGHGDVRPAMKATIICSQRRS